MSSISSITSTTDSSSATTTTSSSSSNSLSLDDFTTLLATELQYQDPTDPVDTSEYISQLASISQLSALSDIKDMVSTLSTSVDNSSAFGLIGKTVTYSYEDSSGDTATASGTVSSVTVSSGTAYLNIGGTKVSMDNITSVTSS